MTTGPPVLASGKASRSALRNWLETSPRTRIGWSVAKRPPLGRARPAVGSRLGRVRRRRSRVDARQSTKSPIGRSCMRGTPRNSKRPPWVAAITARAAVRGRMAVPALPRNRSACATASLPARPCTCTVAPPWRVMRQPSCSRAATMTRVSSESSRSWIWVVPSAKPASSRTRLEMLLEPGSCTLPEAATNGGRSRNGIAYTAGKFSARWVAWCRRCSFASHRARRRPGAASLPALRHCPSA